jgi:hypothetical protein
MNRKLLAFVVSLVAVVVLVVVLVQSPRTKQTASTSVGGASDAHAGVDAARVEPAHESTSEPAARVAAQTVVELFGFVRMGGGPGQSGPLRDGVLTWSFESDANSSERQEVQLDADGWRLRVPDGATVRFHGLQLRGGRFRLRPDSVPASSKCPVELVAEYAPGPRLHIVDAESGEPLSNIALYGGTYNSREIETYAERSGGMVKLGEGLQSPVATPAATMPYLLIWARSPGYAWGSIAIDSDSQTDACLPLHRATFANIQLQDLEPGSAYRLRILFDDGPSSAASPLRGEVAAAMHGTFWPRNPPLRFELPPGDWVTELVSLERPGGGAVSHVTKPQSFSTSAAQEVLVRVPVVTAERPQDLRVALKVEVEGDTNSVRDAYLQPKSTLPASRLASVLRGNLARPSEAEANKFDVTFEAVPAGPYVLSLLPGGWTHDVTVSGEGVTPDFFQLKEPDRVALELSYPAGWSYGPPVSVVHTPANYGIYTPHTVELGPEGVWLKTAAHELGLLLWFKDGIAIETKATVSADRTVATGQIEPFGVLRLRLRDGPRAVCMRASWWDRVQFSDDAGEVPILLSMRDTVSQGDYAVGARFMLARAGSLRVTLPKLPGYPTQPAAQVVLSPANLATLEIELTGSPCSR